MHLFKDYKVIKKILHYLDIYEFKRDRHVSKTLAVADSFDNYAQNMMVVLFTGETYILNVII